MIEPTSHMLLAGLPGGLPERLLAAQPYFLISPYKPILLLVPLIAWAWVVATIYDKDAARFYLARRGWNLIHLAVGLVAVGLVLVAPVMFWISWPIMLVLLLGDLVAYWVLRNRDDRVPEAYKWKLSLETIMAARAGKKAKRTTRGITMSISGPGGAAPTPELETPEYEVRTLTESLLERVMQMRGVQLDVTPRKDGTYGVTFFIDGVHHPIEQLPANMAVSVIDLFKSVAGLDLADRRRKLTGKVNFGLRDGPLQSARLTTMGASNGMRMSLLIDPEAQVARRVEHLGLFDNQQKDLESIINDGVGLVLLSAPPDNGRTTTLYALLRAHDAYTSNVQTLELDPQSPIEGVRQNKFDASGGAEFSTMLRSILRRDPDVVGVAEMPDEVTAKEAARADHDRTRVYLSLPADSALASIQIYARAVGDQKAAAKGLHGVIAHRLMRRLCENCRVPFQPTADVLKKLGLPQGTKQLYRKGGQVLVKDKPQTCPVCGGTGYFGTVGAFAIHPIGPEERELIATNDLSGLRAKFRQKKQQSVQSAALQHVLDGTTSVEEVVRISSSSEGGKTQRKKAAEAAGPTKQEAAAQ